VKFILNCLVLLNWGIEVGEGVAKKTPPGPYCVFEERNMAIRDSPCRNRRWDEWYKNYYQWAVNVAYGFTRDRDEAEDIAQEAFLRIYITQDRYQPTARFKTYLFKIIRNLCIDHFRKESRWVQDVRIAPLLSDEPHKETIDRIEVEKRLSRLPEQPRKVFELFYLEDRSYKEIAWILNISEKTVGNILYYWGKKIL